MARPQYNIIFMRRFHCQLNSALRQPSPAPPANRLVYTSNNAGDWPTKAVSNNSWDEISPKEEAEYLATQDKIQLNDGLLTELQIDVLTKREREIITLMFENSLTAAEIARRWGCSRQSVNQGKIVALKKLRKTFSTPISTKTLHNIERAKR